MGPLRHSRDPLLAVLSARAPAKRDGGREREGREKGRKGERGEGEKG